MDVVNSSTRQIEPFVGVLHVVGGARVEDASLRAGMLERPPRAARRREGERLFILLDLAGAVSPHLYRELREVVARTYWSTTGSITAALRRSAAAANNHLFRANLHAPPSDRCEGGLVSAVLQGDDLFVLQAGSGQAWFVHGQSVRRFSRDEEPPPLGVGPLADVCLYHTFVAPDDTLLLASHALIRQAGGAGLARVLPRAEVQAVLEGLEQVGAGADFAALVVRWALPVEAPALREVPRAEPRARPQPARKPPRPERVVRPISARKPPRPERRVRPKPRREPRFSLGAWVKGRVRSVGRGIVAAGTWVAGGLGTLFRRMLPGPQRATRRRAGSPRPRPPRPVPGENRTVMMAVAVGIPVVLAVVVVLAYLSYGAEARVQGFITQAKEEISLAQAAGGNPEVSRVHWETALDHAQQATRLRPDDPVATEIQAQARAALDLLDGIVRLQPVQLWDFGPGSGAPGSGVPGYGRQLVIHGQMAFVLDPAGGWVAKLTLNPAGDGVLEHGEAPILVRTGQQVGEGEVGDLVDCVWGTTGGDRQTSSLLILEKDGGLVSYDPAWVDEGGSLRVVRSLLGTPPGSPQAVDSFGGRLYVLDTAENQVWRYDPRGDTYPERPDHYFATSPPRSLADALDMAIDGHIYVLYGDGEVLQFLQGEQQPGFVVHGLPDGGLQPVAIAVDRDGNSGAVYVADVANERVVVLGPDGGFRAQWRADEVFDALEALVVNEAAGRLYVISGGRLYVASLP